MLGNSLMKEGSLNIMVVLLFRLWLGTSFSGGTAKIVESGSICSTVPKKDS